MVQSLLDLLCSQLKNLLSQAGVNLSSLGKKPEDVKYENSSNLEKKDFRGNDFSVFAHKNENLTGAKKKKSY